MITLGIAAHPAALLLLLLTHSTHSRLIRWACFGLIILATYTANLTAFFTADLMQPEIVSIKEIQKYAEDKDAKIMSYKLYHGASQQVQK